MFAPSLCANYLNTDILNFYSNGNTFVILSFAIDIVCILAYLVMGVGILGRVFMFVWDLARGIADVVIDIPIIPLNIALWLAAIGYGLMGAVLLLLIVLALPIIGYFMCEK